MTKIREDGTEAPIGFSLQPIYPIRGIASAAVMSCIATGKMISSMGGPGFALSTEVVKALDASRNGGKSRVIADAQDWDDLRTSVADLVTDLSTFTENETLSKARALLERTKS